MVRVWTGRWPSQARWCLVALFVVACDGRSIGAGDPSADGGAPHDGSPPVVIPDAAVIPPDAAAGCEGSPVQGTWRGSFTGEITSSITGTMMVQGTMQLEIYCEESLLVHGIMEGSEQSGVPFEAEVEGEYDEALQRMWATWDGTVYVVSANGSLQGILSDNPQERISGTWQGTAADVEGTGYGQWVVSR